MSWLTQLVNALNVFKKTPSTEKPISTVSTILAEPAVGSITSDSTPGETSHSVEELETRRLRRKWRNLAKRFPNSVINAADRWGMLTALYQGHCICRCLACRRSFEDWEEGRSHECEREKGFRSITKRRISRKSSKKKERSGGTAEGDPGDRSRVEPDGVGVVADSSQPRTSRSRGYQRREREHGGTGPDGEDSPQGAV